MTKIEWNFKKERLGVIFTSPELKKKNDNNNSDVEDEARI